MSVVSEFQSCVEMRLSASKMSQVPYYPLHDSVKNKLHKDYVAFYNKYLINAQQAHLQPISTTRGSTGGIGGTAPLPVGDTREFHIRRQQSDGPNVRVRCFTPEGNPPASGWPVMLYYHGGGWVLGDIDSENNVCTNMCVRSNCVVITTEYRLAPENPFPAAIHDSWETLLWTAAEGSRLLDLDVSRVAVGGSSAGANLAAAIANRSISLLSRLKVVAQLLVVPVLDNTALPCNNPTYQQYKHTASLSAEKMLWYRNHYLPSHIDRRNPDASPLFFLMRSASSLDCSDNASMNELGGQLAALSNLPRALIIVGGLDILKFEGELYARKLRENGVSVQIHVMEGMPHPFLALDAVLEAGRKAITMLCDELSHAFSESSR